MHISWLGNSAVKIQTKNGAKDVTIIIDAYKPPVGTAPRSLAPDIALFTRGDKDAITLSGGPFVLSSPGECETHGVLITSGAGRAEGSIVLRLDAEEVSVGHMGMVSELPTNEAFNILSGVDVLFVPVGSSSALSPELAMKAVNIIEPRIVIPIAFKSDNDPKAETAASFLKEIGLSPAPEKKVIIKKQTLPEEEIQVIVLEKE